MYTSLWVIKWNYHGVFAGPIDGLGYMWECPDYFEINDTALLIISPQGVGARRLYYQNIYQGYLLGEFDDSR